jgi:cell division protein FtsI/penicillin-binding protein 2
MRTFYENDIRKRALVLGFVLAVWAAVVGLRLVQLQVLGHARAKAAVLKQNQDKITMEPRRGNILDRNGEILACSLPAVSVCIRPVEEETPAAEKDKLRTLQRLLGLSGKEVSTILGRLKNKATFTYVKKKASEEEAARVMALKLPGLDFEAANRSSGTTPSSRGKRARRSSLRSTAAAITKPRSSSRPSPAGTSP